MFFPVPAGHDDPNDAYQALVKIQDNMTSDTDDAYSYEVNGDLVLHNSQS